MKRAVLPAVLLLSAWLLLACDAGRLARFVTTPVVTPTAGVQQVVSTPLPSDTAIATAAPTWTPTPTHTPTPTPIASPTQTRQLQTGAPVRQIGLLNGEGKLTIENGLEQDAVAVLKGKVLLLGIYLQHGDTYTVEGVFDGGYTLFFTVGEDWDSDTGSFTRRRQLARFDDPFEFTTTSSAYTAWSVSLQPVAGGTATSHSVGEDDFPDLAP